MDPERAQRMEKAKELALPLFAKYFGLKVATAYTEMHTRAISNPDMVEDLAHMQNLITAARLLNAQMIENEKEFLEENMKDLAPEQRNLFIEQVLNAAAAAVPKEESGKEEATEHRHYHLVFKGRVWSFTSTPENAMAILHKLNEETGHHKTTFRISVDTTDYDAPEDVAEETSFPVTVYSHSLHTDTTVTTVDAAARKAIPNTRVCELANEHFSEDECAIILGWALIDCAYVEENVFEYFNQGKGVMMGHVVTPTEEFFLEEDKRLASVSEE